jgi:phosphoribosylanthranilate isomerase
MVNIKICGLKRVDDVHYANKYLPEYVGFVFAESKRKVSCQQAEKLTGILDNRIQAVGVFVNETIENVINIAFKCHLNVVQIHGDETPSYISKLKAGLASITYDVTYESKENQSHTIEIWKAFRVSDSESMNKLEQYDVDGFVLDAYTEGSYGGSGRTFDWELAAEAGKHRRIILAGGLGAHNVVNAVQCVWPFAVDVSSGVEADGYKDEQKIRQFINTVRSY